MKSFFEKLALGLAIVMMASIFVDTCLNMAIKARMLNSIGLVRL